MNLRERLNQKAAMEKIPIMAAFELLPICNLSCKMCYVRKTVDEVRYAGGIKDGEWWLALAEEARDCGLLYPLLTGGEPFLHPDIRKILERMLEMGLQVSVNSNGTMIDREMAQFLSKNRPVRINLTLYGASAETYRRLCGNSGAYERVLQAVDLCKEYNIPIKFNASITNENVDDLEAMITYAKSVGSPIQIATYMFPPIRRDSTMIGKNARLSPEEAGEARVKADYLQGDPQWFMGQAERFQRFVPLERLDEFRQNAEDMHMQCRAGCCSFWVDWQGNLTNCGMYGSAVVPMEGRPFADAWKELVEETEKVTYHPGCAGCPNRPLCHPCIAMVSNEAGNINGTPEYLCRTNAAASKYYYAYARKYYPNMKGIAPVSDNVSDPCEI